MIRLLTGHTDGNIRPADDRALHTGFIGLDDYVFDSGGNNFRHEIINNNTIRIHDGDGIMQGAHFRISYGSYDDVEIDTGRTGYNRIDLICVKYSRYQKNEDVELVVLKGIETADTAVDPVYTQGSIIKGDTEHYFPLKRVVLDGTNISSITNLYTVKTKTQKLLWSGAAFMMENQVVNLTEPISAQNEGIELIFAPFDADSKKILEGAKCIIRLSKRAIEFLNGESANFFMTGSSNFYHERIAAKTLKFTDTTIIGSAHNELSGTGSSGIKFNNRSFVLCAVIGV